MDFTGKYSFNERVDRMMPEIKLCLISFGATFLAIAVYFATRLIV